MPDTTLRIATLADAVRAGDFALAQTKPYCLPLIESQALRLLLDAARRQLEQEEQSA